MTLARHMITDLSCLTPVDEFAELELERDALLLQTGQVLQADSCVCQPNLIWLEQDITGATIQTPK